MTIYIAEDDLGLARGMKFTLEKEGYQAETFPSLRLLTEAIQTELPDLLLLDWGETRFPARSTFRFRS